MFLRHHVFLLACAVTAAGALFFCAAVKLLGGGGAAGYAVIRADAGVDDAVAARALEPLAGGGGSVISESSQWVLLDVFGGLEKVPLAGYEGRLEPADPRRDGYAEKLAAFFVHGGGRFFFIPLGKTLNTAETRRFEAEAAALVPGAQVFFAGTARPVFFYMILFAAAAIAAWFVCGARLPFLALLPLLAPLGMAGPAGLAVCALAAAWAAAEREDLRDFFSGLRYRKTGAAARASPGKGFFIMTAAFVLAADFTAAWFLPPPFLAVVPCIAAAWCYTLYLESRRGEKVGHVRFRPVALGMQKRRFREWPALPFAAAVCIALVLPSLSPSRRIKGGAPDGVPDLHFDLSAADWEAHARYQSSFSYTPLWDEAGGPQWNHYPLAADGLIAPTNDNTVEFSQKTPRESPQEIPQTPRDFPLENPQFPLEDLVNFLHTWSAGGEAKK